MAHACSQDFRLRRAPRFDLQCVNTISARVFRISHGLVCVCMYVYIYIYNIISYKSLSMKGLPAYMHVHLGAGHTLITFVNESSGHCTTRLSPLGRIEGQPSAPPMSSSRRGQRQPEMPCLERCTGGFQARSVGEKGLRNVTLMP